MTSIPSYSCDVLILGGMLGLWVLDLLVEKGFESTVLLEVEKVGYMPSVFTFSEASALIATRPFSNPL